MKSTWFDPRIQLYLFLIGTNLFAWVLASILCAHQSLSLMLCLLAYGLGLRHGIDADHLAAINSITVKFINEKRPSLLIGLFFSLGHSTIVFLLSLFVVTIGLSLQSYFPSLVHFGSLWGKLFSSGFLILFSLINFTIFCDVMKKIRAFKRGEPFSDPIPIGGPLKTLLNPLLNMVCKNWHIFAVGLLFGLGFDTATEVVLLGLSSYQASQHMPIGSIMIFPLMFAIGMCTVDTLTGLCMRGACLWACIDPIRKLYYNLVITLFSFLTSLLIGGYIVLTLII